MISLLSDIRTNYNTFSKNQKVVANYILDHPDTVTMHSITELAKNCDTSESTVMRLLRKINFDSYQTFRISLAKEVADNPYPTDTIIEEIKENDSFDTIKKKVISQTVTAINDLHYNLNNDTIEKATALILNAERVMFFGVGASSAISMDIMHKFGKLGLNVVGYPDPHFMNILCSHATDNDVFFAISHTGESMEVLNAVQIAKKKGVKIIALTSYSNSTLAERSDIFLSSSTNDKKYHSEAMASRLVQLTIIDILYISAFVSREEEFHDALRESREAVCLNKV